MKKFMVFSLLFFSLSNCSALAKPLEKTKEEKAQIVSAIASGIVCSDDYKMNEMMERGGGMKPILITYSKKGTEKIVVWANVRTQSSMVVKYKDGVACAFGAGDLLVLKYSGGMSI